MRILLTTLGSRGDVEPFLWLARAAREAGHVVRVLIPDDANRAIADLDTVSLGVDFAALSEALQPGGVAALRAYRERVRPAMSHALAAVVDAALEWQPEVIVTHPKLLTVPVAARRLGIVHFVVELTPTLTPTTEFPAAGFAARSLGPALNRASFRLAGLAGAMFRADVRQARQRHGIPAGTELPAPAGSLVAISPSLLPRPADWPRNTRITGDWHAPAGLQELPRELGDFVDADGPFLYAGFGSMTGGDAGNRAEAIIDGARRFGLRVLLATGWGGLAPPPRCLGSDVLLTRSVPHALVLPRASVAVHHGGAGTVHAATRAGVPSIVAPFLGDQPFWARQLHGLGLAGAPLQRDRLTAERVHDAITDALDRAPRVGDVARSMATEDGTAVALSLISGSI